MTISVQTPRTVTTAAAGATTFPYAFRVVASADLLVKVNGATKSIGVDYMVSGIGLDSGAVTFNVPMAGGEIVEIRRNMSYQRATDYQSLGDLRASTINSDFDSAIMLLQQMNESLADLAAPPFRSNVYLSSNITSTVAPIFQPAVATFALEAGKTYRFRAFGVCRAMASGVYGCALRIGPPPGFSWTCSGIARTFDSGSSTTNTYILDTSYLSLGANIPPALASTTVGAAVHFCIELTINCTTGGTMTFTFGSTSGTAQAVRLDAGTLISVEEARL